MGIFTAQNKVIFSLPAFTMVIEGLFSRRHDFLKPFENHILTSILNYFQPLSTFFPFRF